jgi:hypothetical protein
MSSRRTADRQSTGPKPGSSARVILASAVAALLAVVVIVFFIGRDGGSDSDRATARAGSPAAMAHVHGLAVDPRDGQLLAGTHFGAFRVGEDGAVEQFGPTQDFMGFSVAGPGHYLASGHPGAGQSGPGNLGLIQSTDGGESWETVSLEGKADFHTLEARHGRVYGHSGGQLLVSEDGKTWDARAGIPLADLAVSPEDPDTILVTTQQGLGLSTDGGGTFQGLPDTPVLVLVTWTEEGTLVGVDPNGGVHVSEDGGTTWAERGSAGGQPAALTATEDHIFVATVEGDILESDDGGATFRTRYQAA